jgi:hypothetical protein
MMFAAFVVLFVRPLRRLRSKPWPIHQTLIPALSGIFPFQV